MTYDFIAAILFFLPAGLANMTPVIAARVPLLKRWDMPLDFGVTWRGKRLFGANKTWRGLVTGTVVAALSAVLIGYLNQNVIGTAPQLLVGTLLGTGALLGDAIESMLKRQLNIAPGSSWFPFDQLDYIIGGLVAVFIVMPLPLWVVITIFTTYFTLHVAVSYVAYLLGWKAQPI